MLNLEEDEVPEQVEQDDTKSVTSDESSAEDAKNERVQFFVRTPVKVKWDVDPAKKKSSSNVQPVTMSGIKAQQTRKLAMGRRRVKRSFNRIIKLGEMLEQNQFMEAKGQEDNAFILIDKTQAAKQKPKKNNGMYPPISNQQADLSLNQ